MIDTLLSGELEQRKRPSLISTHRQKYHSLSSPYVFIPPSLSPALPLSLFSVSPYVSLLLPSLSLSLSLFVNPSLPPFPPPPPPPLQFIYSYPLSFRFPIIPGATTIDPFLHFVITITTYREEESCFSLFECWNDLRLCLFNFIDVSYCDRTMTLAILT